MDVQGQDSLYVDSLLQITTSPTEDSSIAKAYLELSSHFLQLNGARALYYSQKAHDLAKSSLDEKVYTAPEDIVRVQSIMAAALNRTGFTLRRRGDFPQALGYFLESVQLAEEIGDSTHLSSALFNVGSIYQGLRELDKAETYFQQSLEIREAIKDTATISSSLLGLATNSAAKRDFEAAKYYYEASIQLSTLVGFDRKTGAGYSGLGSNFAYQGEFKQALTYYGQAIDIFTEIEDHFGIYSTLYSTAGVKRDQGKLEEALQICHQALALQIEHDLNVERDILYKRISELHAANGSGDSAYFYLQQFIIARDSLQNVSKNREIVRLESQFEFGKKILEDSLQADIRIREEQIRTEQQTALSLAFGIGIILLLILLITAIFAYRSKVRSNAVIQQSLREKEMLIKEIHHRVKNNLTMVSNLLELQGDFLQDAGAKAAIGEGKSRLNSIALIHQQLYQTDEKTSVEMLEFIEELVAELSFAYGAADRKIQITSSVAPIQLDVEIAISLGLILHELLNNALKYAFPDAKEGTIKVQLIHHSDQQLQLIVADNGIGMPENVSGKSLGMSLIQLLSDEIKGKLTFVKQGGTRCELVFPISRNKFNQA